MRFSAIRTITVSRPGSILTGSILLFLFGVLPTFGITLGDYRRSLQSAAELADQLSDSARTGGKRPDRQRDAEIVSRIRGELPPAQTVEWTGGSVETANEWLGERLDAFLIENDTTKRVTILASIKERLAAIVKKIEELETAVAGGRTKDEDKQTLADILRREEYQTPQVQEKSLFQKWLDKLVEWIASVFPRTNITPQASSGPGSLGFVLQVVVYSLVIGLIGFLIYKFAPFISGRFGKNAKRKKEERIILGDRIAPDESAEDVFAEAERLAREGNLRGAIRKGYIAFLCELNDRKIIGLARHKTNRDYLHDVRSRRELFENMAGLTGNFERNWYGLRPSVQADWEDFRDRYRETISGVRR